MSLSDAIENGVFTLPCQSESLAPWRYRQAQSRPQGHLHVIPACGHYVPLERSECLNDILRGVIADQEW